MGLLKRVEQYLQALSGQNDDQWGLGGTYSEEEKGQILGEIDMVMEQNRLQVDARTFMVHSRKKGWLFPFLVNLSALILLAASFFTLRYFLGNSPVIEDRAPQNLILTEARLLEEIRKESDLLVSRKDEELDAVKQQLQDIQNQKLEIQNSYEIELAGLRDNMLKEMENSISLEIERLRAEGYAEGEIQRRIQIFRQSKERELTQLLEQERLALDQQKKQQDEELTRQEELYNDRLNNLDREKQQLQQQYESKLAEMTEKMEGLENQSQQEITEAQQELIRLGKEKEREENLRNQITGFYNSIRESINQGNYQEAQNSLNLFSSFIDQGTYRSVPSVAVNEDRDRFLIGSLTRYLTILMDPGNVSLLSAIDPAVIDQFNQNIEKAQAASDGNNLDDAILYYKVALQQLPESFNKENLADQLMQISWEKERALAVESQSLQAQETLTLAETRAEQGFQDEALELYSSVLKNYPLAQSVPQIPLSIARIFSNKEVLNQQSWARKLEEEKAAASQREAELSEQLSELRTDMDTILKENQAEGQILETRLEQFQQDIQTLQTELEEKTRLVNQLQDDNSIDLLMTEYETSIAGLNDRISELNLQNQELQDENYRLGQVEDYFNNAKNAYRNYTDYEDSLFSGNVDQKKLMEGKNALNQFLAESSISGLFPGLSTRIKVYDQAFQRSGEQDIALELADWLLIYSSMTDLQEKLDWIDQQIADTDSEEKKEFLENLKLLSY